MIPARPIRIVLTGFMGSGKSTVGRLLAAHLGWIFADLDDHVAAREQLTVPALFAQRGEAYFREAELHTLRDLLAKQNLVIALGGGAPETAALRDEIARTPATVVVYLQAPFPELYDRCLAQARDPFAADRPLARDRAIAEQRFHQRQPLYEDIAHLHTGVAAQTPEEVTAAILGAVAALETGSWT